MAQSSQSKGPRDIVMDSFALRQFDPVKQYGFIDCDPKVLEERVNVHYEACGRKLQDGYAPFCKHLFVPNFTSCRLGYVEITSDVRPLIHSDYVARTEAELPVLSRWIPRGALEPPVASFLDVILYSREQIRKENAATGAAAADTDAPWGIISIKPQHCDHELPMEPITAMRNALPLSEGGSNTPLNREAYMDSVAFWKKHVKIV